MTYDDLHQLMKKRRSTRRFLPDPIPSDSVKKIIDAARLSPSAANSQPWEFIVITDPGHPDIVCPLDP